MRKTNPVLIGFVGVLRYHAPMLLLLDIGNTNTHAGLATVSRIVRQTNVPSTEWRQTRMAKSLIGLAADRRIEAAVIASVVPQLTEPAVRLIREHWNVRPLILTAKTVRGVGVDYPKPKSIGADRLANAVAARHRFGAPAVVVDFGTAVTFDVIDRRGNYIGGIIAAGLAAMTGSLREQTAL